MTSETIGVTVKYKEPVTFHLRMIGINEEEKLRQKMFGLTEREKAEKSYQNNVDIPADISVKIPDWSFYFFIGFCFNSITCRTCCVCLNSRLSAF